jgi:hypothetical protein
MSDDPAIYRISGEATWKVYAHDDSWFARKCYSEFCVRLIPKKEYSEQSEKLYLAALFDNTLFMPDLYEDKREHRTVRSFNRYRGKSCIIGLLLWTEPGKAQDTYRRVGTALLRSQTAGKALDAFRDRVSAYQAGVCERDFRRSDGKGQYTVHVM